MKILLFLVSFTLLLASCSTPKSIVDVNYFKNELNASIIDGFYNNDTVGISKSIYLVK